MDEYLKYDFTITAKQLEEAFAQGVSVTIIVNGMYYEFKPEEKKGEN